VKRSLPYEEFLARCTDIFKLFGENLQQSSLRRMLVELGVNGNDIAGFGSLKLLATLCQLAKIAEENGFDLVSERTDVVAQWKPSSTIRIEALSPLFAVTDLRIADSHIVTSPTDPKISSALKPFSIDADTCKAGWGRALDAVYDTSAASLNGISELF
jgi:hypothetical protein